MSEDCLFCSIREGKFPTNKVYEDDEFFAILDIKPVNPGHVLIMPKEHYRNFLDLPQELTRRYGEVAQKIGRAVQEACKADGINITCNNESAAGQLIFHTHVHIIPRFNNDNLMHWDHNLYKDEREMPEIATKIRDKISNSRTTENPQSA